MTRDDLRILCTALGFSAVVTGDVPQGKQALRATTIAGLIEAFCRNSVPEAFEPEPCGGACCDGSAIDQALGRYKEELRTQGSAELPQDRETLLKFYDRLILRREHYVEHDFYNTGHADLIANRVLRMVEEEISCEDMKPKP